MVQAIAPSSAASLSGSSATHRLTLLRNLGRKIDAADPAAAREAAALTTSQLFFAPMLAEMRKLPFGKEFGYGGRMEEAFGEQLDQRMADIVARGDHGLTEQVAAKLMHQEHKPGTKSSPKGQFDPYEARALIGGLL